MILFFFNRIVRLKQGSYIFIELRSKLLQQQKSSSEWILQ